MGEKDSSRFTIWSRRQALISPGRADLESVQGSGEGNPSPLSSSTILRHQFHDAHRRASVIPSQACWTVMGWMGSIIVLTISKSVEPNEEQKEMINGFQQGILCKY